MYILKDNNNNILSYSKSKKVINDAKIFLSAYETFIEKTDEEIITDRGKAYLKSDWENYIETEEYKYLVEKEKAIKEIDTLKEELQSDDYKIIKAFEYTIKGENPPYNMEEILNARDYKRFRINELQTSFSID